MFDILYRQTYTMQWRHLAALLDMFHPESTTLPEDHIIDEMIDAEYIIYDREKQTFYLAASYRNLVDSFLKTKTILNIESPRGKALGASLSMYYLDQCRHMLVLIHADGASGEDGLVEVSISDKNTNPTKLFEILGGDICADSACGTPAISKSYDPDALPPSYKADYDAACGNNTLFRVTLYNQLEDGSDGTVAVFAAFPHNASTIWLTAMRQKLSGKQKPVLVQQLSLEDYRRQITQFFNLFTDSIWGG